MVLCLNSSSIEDLQRSTIIPAIGKNRAKRIFAKRPFEEWEDLKKVDSIGIGIIKKLRETPGLFLHYPPRSFTSLEDAIAATGRTPHENPRFQVGQTAYLANMKKDWGGRAKLRVRVQRVCEEYDGYFEVVFEDGATGVYDIELMNRYKFGRRFEFSKEIEKNLKSIHFSKTQRLDREWEDAEQDSNDKHLHYDAQVFEKYPFVGFFMADVVDVSPLLKPSQCSIEYETNGKRTATMDVDAIHERIDGCAGSAAIIGNDYRHIATCAHICDRAILREKWLEQAEILCKQWYQSKKPDKRALSKILLSIIPTLKTKSFDEAKIEYSFFPQFDGKSSSKFDRVFASLIYSGWEKRPISAIQSLKPGPSDAIKIYRGTDIALLKLDEKVELFGAARMRLGVIVGSEIEIEQALGSDLICYGYPDTKYAYTYPNGEPKVKKDGFNVLGNNAAFCRQSDHIGAGSLGLSEENASYIQIRGLDSYKGMSGSQLFFHYEGNLYAIGILVGQAYSKPLVSDQNLVYSDTAFCRYNNTIRREFEKHGVDATIDVLIANEIISKQQVQLPKEDTKRKSTTRNTAQKKRKIFEE